MNDYGLVCSGLLSGTVVQIPITILSEYSSSSKSTYAMARVGFTSTEENCRALAERLTSIVSNLALWNVNYGVSFILAFAETNVFRNRFLRTYCICPVSFPNLKLMLIL